jgi:tRNA pseudouridine55 synthase
MAAQRGTSGLSLVVGIDKPSGMTSHDVVNVCRRVFGERRCGHTGTLDPMATGAMAVCVGPATRLDAYVSGQDKTYEARIRFGARTDTDDATGAVVECADVPERLFDPAFANVYLLSLIGTRSQMPPAYSAIKKDGVKSYEAARRGEKLDLKPRTVTIRDADLIDVVEDERGCAWDVRLTVSKGTYIRSIARDAGRELDSAAHLERLRRTATGMLDVEACVSLDELATLGTQAAFDPVRLLGYRVVFVRDRLSDAVANGATVRAAGIPVFEPPSDRDDACCMFAGAQRSARALVDGERICMVMGNKLSAIYRYDRQHDMLKSDCVFSKGVIRGKGI